MAVGDRIRAARSYANLSQTELAEQLGVDKQFVARREDGRQNPKRQELIAIAAVCHVPLEFLEHGWAGAVATEDVAQLADRIAAIEALVNERLGRELREGIQDALRDLDLQGRDPQRTGRRKTGRG